MVQCYLCHNKKLVLRNDSTRDRPEIKVLHCPACDLTFLASFKHLNDFSYNDSKHNYDKPIPSKEAYTMLLKELSGDDLRRVEQHKKMITGKRLLDFGCGAGGFLLQAKKHAKEAYGVEIDSITRFYNKKVSVKKSIEEFNMQFDVITLFHVIEHIPDPIALLTMLKKFLRPGGTIIIEVPNDHDALISYYQLPAFKNFTYWSLHLFSFSPQSITRLFRNAGYKRSQVTFFQRYSFANHIGWLKDGKPGGQNRYPEMDTQKLNAAYVAHLKKNGLCDTLIAYLKK